MKDLFESSSADYHGFSPRPKPQRLPAEREPRFDVRRHPHIAKRMGVPVFLEGSASK